MKIRSILLSTILLIGISLTISCKKDDDIKLQSAPDDYDKEILNLINKHRVSKGLEKLIYNEIIWKSANQHSTNMANGSVSFGHSGFNERVDAINKQIGGGAAAENVAAGQSSAKAVVDSWLNSSGHKQNIEGDYQLTGLSAVKGKNGKWYYTQIFISKK